ncbi:MAG TPA: TonB-dependent receptor [Burkholderiales bacterium]
MPRLKNHNRSFAVRSEGGRLFAAARPLLVGVSLLVLAAGAAGAQETNTDVTQLETVTVVGEKTERTLQETGTSASVLTDRRLDELPGLNTLDEVLGRLPNVVGSGTGNFAPTVRGNDATGPANGVFAFLAGTRPRMTVQQDGRPLSFNELIYGRSGLWDAERIEVLRGPQTTVQGRNSIAGAVVVETKDPSFKPEAAARAMVGNYDTYEVAGMVSGPINDQVAYRLSVDQRYHDSWVDVTGNVGIDDPTQEKALNVRGKLLFAPAALPELSAKLTLSHTDTRRPQTEYVDAPFAQRRFNGADFPVFENKTDSSILNVNYALSENLELRNTTTYSDIEIRRLTNPGSGNVDIRADEVTNELLLDYRFGALRGILGTYFLAADADEVIDIGPGSFDDKTRTVAIFGEGTRTFFDKWDLTLGARYERESRERFGGLSGFIDVDLDETYDAFLPKLGIAYRPNDRHTVGFVVQRGWNAGGAGVDFSSFTSFIYDEEFVWNYEAYFRSRLLDGRLQLTGNVFYADYENHQRLAYLDPSDPASGVIRNAESTAAYGAEIGVQWLARSDLELFASVGLLETEIKRFSASALDLTGNEFARAPKFTASFGAIHRRPSGFTFGFDGQYVGSYFSDDDNDPAEKVDGYFLLNAQVAYERRNLRVYAFVTNILDKDHELLLFDGNAQLVDPREVGVGVQVKL